MTRLLLAAWLLVAAVGCATSAPGPMSQELLATHIEEIAGDTAVSGNLVEFRYDGVAMACVSDASHDRMRLIAPIARRDAIEATYLEIMLIANFHTTLDARYAIGEGIVYAAFLHPLSSLTRVQLESAIRQVSALARNFGSSFSSDELIFGVEAGDET